jgi:uncharacterized DUF497 family protein
MKDPIFYWDDANSEHIAKHGVTEDEAESAVRRAERPYPKRQSRAKWIVRGTTGRGRRLQVVYVERDIATIDLRKLPFEDRVTAEAASYAFYVIHARELRRGE